MNVLHVTPSMSPLWGGPVAVVSELIPALSAKGIRCEIATTRGHRVGYDPVSTQDVPIHVFDTGFLARIWTSYSKGMSKFLEENIARFDLVHVHEVWHHAGYAAFQSSKRYGVPFVLTMHGELSEWRRRHKGWKKRIYTKAVLDHILRNADALHAIIQAEKDQIANLGYETSSVTVAPNGIDPTQFSTLPNPSRVPE